MAASVTARQNFVQQSLKFMAVFGFDGLDIDWEYPGFTANGCNAGDTVNFISLMQELRQAINTFNSTLLLTATTPAFEANAEPMALDKVQNSVDFFNLMAYDYYGAGWSTVSGENAPLYGQQNQHDGVNVADTLAYYLNKLNLPPQKVVLGIGAYGHTFQSTTLGAASSGPGPAGTYTRQAGILAYYEIEQLGGNYNFNAATQCPFITYGGTYLVGYDDQRSVDVKVKYLKSLGLGGAMVWALDLDDFNNNFPLISQISTSLK